MTFVAKVEPEVFKSPTPFGMNWKELLGDGAIVKSTWVVPENLVRGKESVKGAITEIFLSGGALGITHKIKNQVVIRARRRFRIFPRLFPSRDDYIIETGMIIEVIKR